MPARLERAAAARSVISRAEQFVARWPGGYGRTLWQRVVMIQDEPADLALGLWFACAGAQVQMCCADASPWVPERDDALMPRLKEIIAGREPRLLTQPLVGLQHDNYHVRWGFAYLQGSDADLAGQLAGPIEVVLFDGLTRLSRDPAGLLRLIYEKTQWSSSIEILPRPGDADIAEVLDEVRRHAIALRYGERAIPGDQSGGLSLVRLGAPMSDHPVLEDATIMAHCSARLDVAAGVAKGKTILDAGGWAGLGAERYLEAGARRVVNLDISKEAIALGKSRLGADERAEFVQWDLNQAPLPFDDASFDLVICLEALEHIHAQRQAVAEFFRVLEPGGMLLVSVPDREFETIWERINQHGNAYHLHVPTRREFEDWLEAFESIRWLRQTDVTGTFVFEERPRKLSKDGKFAIGKQWDAKSARPQVVMALCIKPDATVANSKQKRTPAIVSDLHLYTSHNDQIARMREDEAALKASVRQERFEWWTRANGLESRLQGLTAELADAQRETEQWQGRVRTDEQIAAMQARFDHTQKAIEAITGELAAARVEREAESKRWLDEIHYQSRVLNETQRQRSETGERLSESARQLAEVSERAARQSAKLEQMDHELQEVRRESNERIEQIVAHAAESRAELAAAQTMVTELTVERVALRAQAAASGASLAASQSLVAEMTLERAALRAQAAEEHADRERIHAELMQSVSRLSARLDDDRRTLLQRIEALLEQSMDQVDRRCLTIEGKVYDLEDELDHPAVSPHRNGSPTT